MSNRTRSWMRFGTLVGVAFLLGLIFASTLELPALGSAAQRPGLQAPRPATAIPAAQPAADLGDAFAAVAEHVQPTVVFVRSERRERASARRLPPGFEDLFPQRRGRPQIERGSGSGFIVSPDGYILTNYHVVQSTDRVTVRLFDKREFEAKVVGLDAATDVAVIKIDARGLPAVEFGDSDSTRIGEWVLAIGNPLGELFAFTVTAGIVSAKGRLLQGLEQAQYSIQDFIQTDAAINPGNSGGPLVNVRGRVIGINSAIASETGTYTGYGFAIPIKLARVVMDQLIAHGYVERAVMGVSIRDANEEDAQLVGLDRIRGVVVQDFTDVGRNETSPAQRAGLQPGDVIVELDGQAVEYVAQLQQRVGFKKPGETVRVTVLRRGGARTTIPVRLAAAPRDDATLTSRSRPADDAPGAAEPAGTQDDLLGITFEPLTEQKAGSTVRLQEAMRQGGGLIVTEVSPDGPAYGRLLGTDDGGPDILVRVNDKPVASRADLRAALRGLKSGDIVTLYVLTRAQQWAQRVVRVRLK